MSSNRPKRGLFVIAALLLVALGFVIGTTVTSTSASSVYLLPKQQAAPTQAASPSTENERYFSDIYNRVSPSVVSINVTGIKKYAGDGGFFTFIHPLF